MSLKKRKKNNFKEVSNKVSNDIISKKIKLDQFLHSKGCVNPNDSTYQEMYEKMVGSLAKDVIPIIVSYLPFHEHYAIMKHVYVQWKEIPRWIYEAIQREVECTMEQMFGELRWKQLVKPLMMDSSVVLSGSFLYQVITGHQDWNTEKVKSIRDYDLGVQGAIRRFSDIDFYVASIPNQERDQHLKFTKRLVEEHDIRGARHAHYNTTLEYLDNHTFSIYYVEDLLQFQTK